MDNAPINVSKETKEKIREMEIQWLSIFLYSSSLNSIEKVIGGINPDAEANFTMNA